MNNEWKIVHIQGYCTSMETYKNTLNVFNACNISSFQQGIVILQFGQSYLLT